MDADDRPPRRRASVPIPRPQRFPICCPAAASSVSLPIYCSSLAPFSPCLPASRAVCESMICLKRAFNIPVLSVAVQRERTSFRVSGQCHQLGAPGKHPSSPGGGVRSIHVTDVALANLPCSLSCVLVNITTYDARATGVRSGRTSWLQLLGSRPWRCRNIASIKAAIRAGETTNPQQVLVRKPLRRRAKQPP